MREGSHGATEVTGRTGGLPWAHPTPLLRYVVKNVAKRRALTTAEHYHNPSFMSRTYMYTMKHIRTADFLVRT